MPPSGSQGQDQDHKEYAGQIIMNAAPTVREKCYFAHVHQIWSDSEEM